MGTEAPSNRTIDALFAEARSARIRGVAPNALDPATGPVLVEFGLDDLARLRETLRIRETEERFHCMCLGDFAVELRGRVLSNGVLSFHHGQSLRSDAWNSDAWLVDGPAMLRLLAERGVSGPLQAFENAQAEGRARASDYQRWIAAVPASLRASMDVLDPSQRGMPSTPSTTQINDALATMREALGGDRAVASELLRWLSVGRGPYSGYASYESLPLTMLNALPHGAIIEAACAETDEAHTRAAARFFASHDVVSFRKNELADVPDAFFARARPIVAAGVADDLVRFDHAVRVAHETRERRTRTAPYPLGGDCTVIGESLGGPLSGLAVLAAGRLISADVRTIVRFDPGSITPVRIGEASEHFVVVGAAGERVIWATMNAKEVHSRVGDGPIVRIAANQPVPLEIVTAGDRIAWLCRDAPGGRQIVAWSERENAPRALATVPDAWMLCADETHVYFVAGGFQGEAALWSVTWAGESLHKVCALPKLGPSMATPRTMASQGQVLVAADERVLTVDPHTGQSHALVTADGPVRAIAANETWIALIVGSESDNAPWEIHSVARRGGNATRRARFSRAPYHRHPLVIANGRACTIAGDKLIAAEL